MRWGSEIITRCTVGISQWDFSAFILGCVHNLCFSPHCWTCPRLANVCSLIAPLRGRALLLSLAYSGIPQHGYGAEHQVLAHWRGSVTLDGILAPQTGDGREGALSGSSPDLPTGDPAMEICLECSLCFRHHVQMGSRRGIQELKALSGIMAFR